MARGITQNDVWKACDALLLEGARPTIERVRQKIGSGSPNTVSPFLDTWFRHLGGRIKDPGAFSAPSDVPEAVQQAAKHFWEMALAETRHDFDLRLKEGMAAAVANVEAEKERASRSEAATFEATNKLSHLQSQHSDLSRTFETERLAHATVQADLANARQAVEKLESRLVRSEEMLVAERAQARTAVAAAEQRADGATKRAALEIEQERQTRIKGDKALDGLRAQLGHAEIQLRDAAVRHAEEVTGLRSLLTSAQQSLKSLQTQMVERSAECGKLREQLASQREQTLQATAQANAVQGLLNQLKPTVGGTRTKKPKNVSVAP